jgi:DNA-binding beta-propeller fold protein YncE
MQMSRLSRLPHIVLATCLFIVLLSGCEESKPTATAEDLGFTEPLQTVVYQARNPFTQRIPIPDSMMFPKDMDWLNTGPLNKRDLRGKFVILDFWTYCCINCHHILPNLRKLEEAYPDEIVVIGVHSAKFDEEKDTENIRDAIIRHDIRHPVINDADHKLWNLFGVQSWPTLIVIDPEGYFVAKNGGEITFEALDAFFKKNMPYYANNKLIDKTPLRFELEQFTVEPTPLKYPGKVLADEASQRLFVTDSSHNRIVISDFEGNVQDIIGTGSVGRANGGYDIATFDHPQGLALHENTLYVADVENHMIRKINLESKRVTTIAGIGKQGQNAFPGSTPSKQSRPWFGKPKSTAINSPWALWVHNTDLFIAMAGPHQIWRMPLDESIIGPYAGNGREDIVDGPLLPNLPYALGSSSFAQPSGLTSDGEYLYIADSEGSSIRGVPFDRRKSVMTVVGTSGLPRGRLFYFGDQDGPKEKVKLQHVLGVQYHEGNIYITDTYNDKIKVVDAATGTTKTIAGNVKGEFDEPSGITIAGNTLFVADTNNHKIRTIELGTFKVATLDFPGLEPPEKVEVVPEFTAAVRIPVRSANVQAVDGKVKLAVSLKLPIGWKMNPQAPQVYYVQDTADGGPLKIGNNNKVHIDTPTNEFVVEVPVSGVGEDVLTVSMDYYYCQDNENGLCKVASVVFAIPLVVSESGTTKPVTLTHSPAAF